MFKENLGDEFDVAIIGAGAAGLRLSYLLGKNGFDTIVVEKEKFVKIKSTGLVSYRIFELAKELDKRISLKSFKKAKFVFGKKHFFLETKKKMHLLDLNFFGKELFEIAKENDVKFLFCSKFLNFNSEILTTNKKFRAKVLVGADGSFSNVAKSFGINLGKETFHAAEGKVESNYNDFIEIHFDDFLSKNYFAWVVPQSERIGRVGLITEENCFEKFLKFLNIRFGNASFKDFYSSLIRIGLSQKTCFENGILIGNSAGMVKPHSAGGIIYSFIAAEKAANAIKKAFECNDFSEQFFRENYENEWKKILEKAISKGYLVRRVFKILKRNDIALNLCIMFRKLLQMVDLDLL